MDEYLGTIKAFAFNYAPRGWAVCAGQLLSISQNSALFSLLGTTYGGDGVRTFQLPDLRGRSLEGVGQAPGHDPVEMGKEYGGQKVELSEDAAKACETQGAVGINYCICLMGIYPPRN
ncbi:MAG: phage tail protein [Gammaproteobacteria bacterium]|nr:phage tail protein [Gammaproteobacteria bacterium]